nr:TRAP transporter small permease subunit [Dissulfuribacter thermophilus]
MVTFDVVLRYCFNKSFIATQELELTIFSAMFLLGAGYTLKKDSHVRVDVIYHRVRKRKKAFINCIGTIIFLIPGCFLAIKTAIPFVEASWRIGEGSPDPGGLPAYYLIKGLIPLGFFLLALQAISFFIDNLRLLLGKQARKDVKH